MPSAGSLELCGLLACEKNQMSFLGAAIDRRQGSPASRGAARRAQAGGEPHRRSFEPTCAGRFIFLGTRIEGFGVDANMTVYVPSGPGTGDVCVGIIGDIIGCGTRATRGTVSAYS